MSNHPQKSGSLCSGMSGSLYPGMSGSLYSGIGGSLYPGILNLLQMYKKVYNKTYIYPKSFLTKEMIRFTTNVWRYEKLPIAGDFLSSYTKVEADYNP